MEDNKLYPEQNEMPVTVQGEDEEPLQEERQAADPGSGQDSSVQDAGFGYQHDGQKNDQYGQTSGYRQDTYTYYNGYGNAAGQDSYQNNYQNNWQNGYQNNYQDNWQNGYPNSYPNGYQNNGQTELEEPVKISEWVLALVLMMIPCVNIIMMFVWAFSSTEKKSKSNFFKAYLIFFGISMGIMLLLWVAIVFIALLAA